jgi:hypothetical protein
MDQERQALFEVAEKIVFGLVAAMAISTKEMIRISFYRMMFLGFCYEKLPGNLSEQNNFQVFRAEASAWMHKFICTPFRYIPVEFAQLLSYMSGRQVVVFKANSQGYFVEAFHYYPETFQEGIILQPSSPSTYFHLSQP